MVRISSFTFILLYIVCSFLKRKTSYWAGSSSCQLGFGGLHSPTIVCFIVFDFYILINWKTLRKGHKNTRNEDHWSIDLSSTWAKISPLAPLQIVHSKLSNTLRFWLHAIHRVISYYYNVPKTLLFLNSPMVYPNGLNVESLNVESLFLQSRSIFLHMTQHGLCSIQNIVHIFQCNLAYCSFE